MALPYSSLPHVLSADDVFPAELLNRINGRGNDAASLLEKEHGNDPRDDGVHGMFNVPYAVALFSGPGASGDSGSVGRLEWSDGFRSLPEWVFRNGLHFIRIEANRESTSQVRNYPIGGGGVRVTLKLSSSAGSARKSWRAANYTGDGMAIIPIGSTLALGRASLISEIDSVFIVVR